MHLAQRNAISAKLFLGKFFALTVKAVYMQKMLLEVPNHTRPETRDQWSRIDRSEKRKSRTISDQDQRKIMEFPAGPDQKN